MTFSGNFAITFYAVDIFQNVSPFVNEYLSAVIIGIIKFVGALLYIPAIKYVSRRILICGSAFVMGIRYVFLSKKKNLEKEILTFFIYLSIPSNF